MSPVLRFTPPQLATSVDTPPEGENWIHEIKHDGYRCEVLLEGGQARVLTRNAVAFPQRHPLTPVAKTGMPGRSAPLLGITTAVVATKANPAATSSAIQCVIPSMTISPEVFALEKSV